MLSTSFASDIGGVWGLTSKGCFTQNTSINSSNQSCSLNRPQLKFVLCLYSVNSKYQCFIIKDPHLVQPQRYYGKSKSEVHSELHRCRASSIILISECLGLIL